MSQGICWFQAIKFKNLKSKDHFNFVLFRKSKNFYYKNWELSPFNEIYEEYSIKLDNSQKQQKMNLEKHNKSLRVKTPILEIQVKGSLQLQSKLNSKNLPKQWVKNHLSIDRSSVLEMSDKYDPEQKLLEIKEEEKER